MAWRHLIYAVSIACAGARFVPASAGVAAQAQPGTTPPAFHLPRPSGPLTVGTTAFRLVDQSRVDPFSANGEPRSIEVIAWYPAVSASSGQRAPYLRAGLAEARTFATLMRQPEDVFDYLNDARTHALVDAPPRTGERLPVLVFSHGYTAIASSYTALLEDLASHGFAVLSIVHPYEAMAATLADGRVVTMLDDQKQMRKGIRDVLGEWAKEDEKMLAVTRAKTDDEALAIMRSYLDTLPLTTATLDRWVDDTTFVLDRLAMLPAGPAARLASRLDTRRVGAFGHSMGGVTAAEFCAGDRRCRAGLNLDGIPQYGSLIDNPMGRPFLMVYSGREGRLGASDVIYRRTAKPYRRVDVGETLHNDFSDMVLWGGPLANRPIFGRRPAAESVAITRRIVRGFFDQQLRGRRSQLLSGTATVPGVRVH